MRGLMAFDETYDEPEYTEVLVKSLDPGHPVELRYAHAGTRAPTWSPPRT